MVSTDQLELYNKTSGRDKVGPVFPKQSLDKIFSLFASLRCWIFTLKALVGQADQRLTLKQEEKTGRFLANSTVDISNGHFGDPALLRVDNKVYPLILNGEYVLLGRLVNEFYVGTSVRKPNKIPYFAVLDLEVSLEDNTFKLLNDYLDLSEEQYRFLFTTGQYRSHTSKDGRPPKPLPISQPSSVSAGSLLRVSSSTQTATQPSLSDVEFMVNCFARVAQFPVPADDLDLPSSSPAPTKESVQSMRESLKVIEDCIDEKMRFQKDLVLILYRGKLRKMEWDFEVDHVSKMLQDPHP